MSTFSDRWPAAVIEHFEDGTQLTHYFKSREEADLAAEHGRERQPNRTYEVVEVAP